MLSSSVHILHKIKEDADTYQSKGVGRQNLSGSVRFSRVNLDVKVFRSELNHCEI
jgi:hypothetical protein